MLKYFVLFIWSIASISLNAQKALVIKNITILNPWNKSLLTDQNIYIELGKIRKIVSSKKDNPTQSKYTIIDGAGKYILPGLSEMHAHIPVPDSTGSLQEVSNTLFLYMANGVTTIRGMLGHPFHLKMKELFTQSHQSIFVPNIYTSSPSLNGNTIPDKQTAEKLVKEYKSAGYHFLKIHPGIKKEVYDQVAHTAQAVGIDFAGHVPVEVGISHALQKGQKTIDHIDGYIEALAPPLENLNQNGFFGYNVTAQVDFKKIDPLSHLTVKSKAWIVPTQSLFTRWFAPIDSKQMINEPEMKYIPARTRYAWNQNKSNLVSNATYNVDQFQKFLSIRKNILFSLYKSGALLLLGSDAPQVMNVPGFSIHHEMKSWADAGIPNWDILKAGTISVATFYKKDKTQGKIAEGYDANFLILEKNPVSDITNSKSILAVCTAEKFYTKDELDKKLTEMAAYYER